VLQDLLGLSAWQPPFAPPMAQLGESILDAASRWAKSVESGRYLADSHPYRIDE
jgi:3-methyl-2-oxobutanoate hydroxymethyltransferase